MIVPFLGSGASFVGAKLPDANRLAEELIQEMGSFPGKVPAELAKVAQFAAQVSLDRALLYRFLHRRLEQTQRDKPPSDVAVALANTPRASTRLFLITTNYDTCVERAFEQAGRPLCVITQNMRDPDQGGAKVGVILPDGRRTECDSVDFHWRDEQFTTDCAFLFKMHGSVDRAEIDDGPDDVIITEDDYVDFMLKFGGVPAHFPPPSLTAAYKKRRFLFLGYSLQDWNFRAFLRVLTSRHAISREEDQRHWAIQLHPDGLEVDLWSKRNVNVFDGDLADFCVSLAARWQNGN